MAILQQKYLWVIFRAILFSLVLNLPSLLLLIFVHPDTPQLIDIDDTVYLKQPYLLSEGKTISALYYEHNELIPISKLLLQMPNKWIDFLVGTLGNYYKVMPWYLGIIFDVLFAIISFIIFRSFFLLWTKNTALAELSALTTLSFPWLSFIFELINVPISLSPLLVNIRSNLESGITPTLRNYYTQCSYPLFGFCYFYLVKIFFLKEKQKKRELIVCGIAIGLLFYFYFFAWLACLTSIVILIILHNHFEKSRSIKKWFTDSIYNLLWIGVAQTVIIIPGLLSLFSAPNNELASDPCLSKYWFFPVFRLILLAVLIILYLTKIKKSTYSKLTTFCLEFSISCIFSEFILNNLQPLLGKGLAPYHFAGLFLYPFLGGIVFITFLASLENKITNNKLGFWFFKLLLIFFLAIFVFSRSIRAINKINDAKTFEDLISLVKVIKQQSNSASVIATNNILTSKEEIPHYFSLSSFPTGLSLLTNTKMLYQDWIITPDISQKEQMERELLVGWLISGKLKLLWGCPDHPLIIPEDVFNLTWSYHLINRFYKCQSLGNKLPENTCDLLKKYQINYLAWANNKDDGSMPNCHDTVCPLIWKSQQGLFSLYTFSNSQALKYYKCDP